MNVHTYIKTALQSIEPNIGRIIASVFIVLFIYLMRRYIRKALHKTARKYKFTGWENTLYYLSLFITLIALFLLWLPHLHSVLTFLSIIATALVITIKEVILNFVGWVYIVFRKPFEVGNRIRIKDYIGDVIDIRAVEFSMIEVTPREQGGQSTGKVIRVPNSLLFTEPLINTTKDFSFYWNEVEVSLSTESNWEKATEILESISKTTIENIYENDKRLQNAETKYSIKYRKIDPKVYLEYSNGSIKLFLRHLSEPRKTRDLTDAIWKEVLKEFSRHDDIVLS